MEKVLIVEDDEGISDFVNLELQHEGYSTAIADTGRKALEQFESFQPQLILLDIMLPELSGLEVLRRIRKTSDVPVILLTARGETFDKVNGLNAGADDYLAKPFEIEELLARMGAVLRRTQRSSASACIKNRELELNSQSMSATFAGALLTLSKTEFMMLKYFMEHIDTVLSRDSIISAVWGKDHYIDENNVDVYVGYLRSKIDQVAQETYIKTVRGSGYMMIGTDINASISNASISNATVSK
ncbi:MAG: response regulator transcription factor [Treponema sp.]|nr:response regulator transcription factor [Treponema sp.]